MTSKHGSDITDTNGYLMRDRPEWDVPIGLEAARLLGADLTERETQILLAVERLGYATTEQISRAFFNSHRSAYEALLQLVNRRFLASLGADTLLIRRSVGHRPPPRNPVYILDWNGYYYLTSCCGYHLHNWRASTIAIPSSRFGHALGVSEVWSHLVAVARATQEFEYMVEREDDWGYRLAVHFRNERAARLIQRRVVGVDEDLGLLPASASSDGTQGWHGGYEEHCEQERPNRKRYRPASMQGRILLQPDGAFTFSIRELGTRFVGDTDEDGEVGEVGEVGDRGEANARDKALTYPSVDPLDRAGRASRVIHPRWDPTLNSWEDALLHSRPSRRTMREAEERAGHGEYGMAAASSKREGEGEGHTNDPRLSHGFRKSRLYYRTLLLEMETGANSPQDVRDKIAIYNRLLRNGEEMWTGAYGIAPRVLVVVRHDAQIEAQASIWRAHYLYKKGTAVLLTSLQTLARASRSGKDEESNHAAPACTVDRAGSTGRVGKMGRVSRRALLDERCWLDVMSSDPVWKSLGEALKIGPVRR